MHSSELDGRHTLSWPLACLLACLTGALHMQALIAEFVGVAAFTLLASSTNGAALPTAVAFTAIREFVVGRCIFSFFAAALVPERTYVHPAAAPWYQLAMLCPVAQHH